MSERQPTPPQVVEAIKIIAAYLCESGFAEAIISDSGGASFYLTSVYDFIGKGAQEVVDNDRNA